MALSETVDDVWVTDVSDSICTRWILDMLNAATENPRVDFRAEEYASQVALVAAGLCVRCCHGWDAPPCPTRSGSSAARTGPHAALHRRLPQDLRKRRPAIRRLIEELEYQLMQSRTDVRRGSAATDRRKR